MPTHCYYERLYFFLYTCCIEFKMLETGWVPIYHRSFGFIVIDLLRVCYFLVCYILARFMNESLWERVALMNEVSTVSLFCDETGVKARVNARLNITERS